MKKIEFNIAGSTAVVYDFEFDKNFTAGIYKNEKGIYQETATFMFQTGMPGTTIKPGSLRARPYFICRGKDIPGGSKKLEKIISEANNDGKVSLEQLKIKIKEELPSAELYQSYEDFTKKTLHADTSEIFRVAGIPYENVSRL